MSSIPFLHETCAVCGEPIGLQNHIKLAQGQCLCGKCHAKCHPQLTKVALSKMGPDQVRQHIGACQELRDLYHEQFTRTRAFYTGKKRNLLALEVDEEHGLWADPSEEQPLAHPLDGIVDYGIDFAGSVSYASLVDYFTNSTTISAKDLNQAAEELVKDLYASDSSIDLPDFKAGELPTSVKLNLALDQEKTLIATWALNLPRGKLALSPSNFKAAIACAADIVVFLKRQRLAIYTAEMKSRYEGSNANNDRFSLLAARGHISSDEADLLHYYLYRIPLSAFECVQRNDYARKPLRYQIVKGVVDAVSANIYRGQKAPAWKSQIDADPQMFYSAVARYAPGIAMSEIVCISDNTKLMSGRDGFLLALDSFAADRFSSKKGEGREVSMPIAYDDLMCVHRDGAHDLVCMYRDGRSCRLSMGNYAHYLFAVLNCIIMLRSNYESKL